MSIAKRVLNLLFWLLFLLAGALLTVMVLIPRLNGWMPLAVLSGSMEPTIPTGSMVVVERVQGEADVAAIRTGDVITFLPHPDDPTLVTHRVMSQAARADGTTVFVTRGDANSADDPEPVTAPQVRGVLRYHVPVAGRLSLLLDPEQKRTGVILAAGGLFLYAGWQVVTAVRTPRESRRR